MPKIAPNLFVNILRKIRNFIFSSISRFGDINQGSVIESLKIEPRAIGLGKSGHALDE